VPWCATPKTAIGEHRRDSETADVNNVVWVSDGWYGLVVLSNGCWGRATPEAANAVSLAIFDQVTFISLYRYLKW
jgi:hypothetical protein